MNDRILNILMKTIQSAGGGLEITKESLKDDEFESISLLLDNVLESVDHSIEQALGGNSNYVSTITKSSLVVSSNGKEKNTSLSRGIKPQDSFIDIIDNSPETLFVCKLTSKPHAIVPLEAALPLYSNPYEPEIRHFEPSSSQLLPITNIPPFIPIEEATLVYVDTLESLQSMIEALSLEKQIAIDLEAHSDHSYQGFLCLMQISTRSMDYIIDVIALRQFMQSMNVITTDPSIEKVLHGAKMDILWLQRCFGVYIVNMFDTGQAARQLSLPSFGLAYLLKQFCNVDANKKYQTADWRIRPLNDVLVKYAQEDTHYLLYIADHLKTQLFDLGIKGQASSNSLLKNVYNNSTEICLQVYKKTNFNEKLFDQLIDKYDLRLNDQQRVVFASLLKWRDEKAREFDESPHFVIPNHILIKISTSLPVTVSQLHACCNPVPSVVSAKGHEVISLIFSASKSSSNKNENLSSNEVKQFTSSSKDTPITISSNHDMTYHNNNRNNEDIFKIVERKETKKDICAFAKETNQFSKTSNILFGERGKDDISKREALELANQIRSTLTLSRFFSTFFSTFASPSIVEEESHLRNNNDNEEKEEKIKGREEKEEEEDLLPLSIASTYAKTSNPINRMSKSNINTSSSSDITNNNSKKRKLNEDNDEDNSLDESCNKRQMTSAPFEYNQDVSKNSGVYNPFLIKKAVKGASNHFRTKKK